MEFDTQKYYYDKDAAELVVNFIERYVTHVKGEYSGQRIKLEEWQKGDIIRPLFGLKRKKDNLRRYRTCYVEIPRKNAKSTLGAALALYLLLGDGESGAEVYSAAGDRDQARIIFDIAKGMVVQNSTLSERAELFQYHIKKKGSQNFYKAISAEAGTKHGLNPHGVIFDELHVQKDRELWDVLTTAQGARTQPLTLAFTTAGYDKDSICYEVHEYARKVRDGIITDDSFLPVLYAADPNSDIYGVDTWRSANPGFGTIVKEDFIRQQANRIKNEPSFESTFRRLHLNQWVGSAETWIADDVWMGCSSTFIPEEGAECYGGLDLAATKDITALVLVFPQQDETFGVVPYFFVPEDSVQERSLKENIHYDQWVKEGYITSTSGNVADYGFIKEKVFEVAEKYDLRALGYDRWNASQLVIELTDAGVPMSPFGQGFASMSAPTKHLERSIVSGKVAHGGNPVLRWMNSNVQIAQDPGGGIKIHKTKSREKVDGMVALVMAIGEWMTDESPGPSVYENEDYEIPTI